MRPRQAPAPHALWWLALALVLAQGLGLWHAHEHALPRAMAVVAGAEHRAQHAADHGADHHAANHATDAHGHESASEPWSHEAGDESCRLLDQLLALALPSAKLSPPSLPAAEASRWPPPTAARAAPAWAGYLARAPPVA